MANANSKKVIYAALAGNALIAVTKFVAAGITGSSAMLAEGIHSVVDTGNQGLMLHGTARAKKPADENHPFGYGRELYFWAFVVAILIFAVGAGVSLYEGVEKVLHPHPVTNPVVNYVVLLLAMGFEGWAFSVALKEFQQTKGDRGYIQAVRESKDPTVITVLFEDTAALSGLVVAFLGVGMAHLFGWAVMDGVASIVIGLILGVTAFLLAYETKGLLVGESALPHVTAGIRSLVRKESDVERVNQVLTLQLGPDDVLATVSVEFADGLPTGRIEQTIARLDAAIKQAQPEVTRVYIEAETAR
ncbi:cation diffusion facilitator family transporter [Rhodovibrio salinarum]|uniref:Cation transporter n=1 Tax=Rhodovibrio salinarum TaxID=1087 RepID=A0A934QGM4_9PROT|nr:cation diffusion facilitator family transporter [Rhodovibrio salinarum]MBK1696200.1 cation transporter [Rhodovibrio salinarum]